MSQSLASSGEMSAFAFLACVEGNTSLIPVPLDLSAVYVCFTNPKDKVPTCQVHLFLREKKKTFFSLFVDLGQMSFVPWQK